MTALQRAADRLARGSGIVWQRRTTALAAWVRAGRRDDLTGWRATLGCWARLAALGAVAWILCSVLRAVPWLCGLLVALWCRAAWKAGRSTTVEPAEEAPDVVTEDQHRAALVGWLDEVTRGRNGIHLGELHKRLAERPALTHLKRADLAPLLRRYEVPVERTLRVDGIAGRSGVSRAAVEHLLAAALSPVPSSGERHGSPHLESASDQQKSPDSPATLRRSPLA